MATQRLPRAIQAQVEEADKLLAAANAPADPQPNPDEPPASPAPDATPPQPPAPPPASDPPPAPPAPPAQPRREDTAEFWRHKFNTLQGVFNAQMPQLQQNNAKLTEQVQALQASLEELRKAPAAPAPAPAPENAHDVSEFGKELVDMVQRQVRAYIAPVAGRFEVVVQKLEQRLAAVEESAKTTTEKVALTSEELFYQQLASIVPDWLTLNQDQGFLAWLGENDPIYRVPRQVALDRASEKYDAHAAAAVFQAYKQLVSASAPPPAPPMEHVREQQIQPKGNGSAPPPPPPQPEMITSKFVENFYLDVAKGKYRGREKEAAAIDAKINAALSEGRIR